MKRIGSFLSSQITPRTWIYALIFLFGIFVTGYAYIDAEYIVNKGPDDVKAQSYVAAYMRAKYGDFDGDGMATRILRFEPDQPEEKTGWYSIACSYKGHIVTVRTHYNGSVLTDWSELPRENF
jgi:hypothetical protein